MGLFSAEWRQEKLTEQFYRWELRGRGWDIWKHPVMQEPPFRPFYGHFLPRTLPVDDGRQPTFLSSLVEKLRQSINPDPPSEAPETPDEEEASNPDRLERNALVEIAISLPQDHSVPREAFEQFLFAVSSCREAVTFEIAADTEAIRTQFAVHPSDADLIERHLSAYFPEAAVTRNERTLADEWDQPGDSFIVEFALEHEFMLPLPTKRPDLLLGLTASLSALEDGETGLFQVIFEPVRAPWAESILHAVSDGEGGPFFVNRPELVPAAKQKVSRPLFAAVVRIAVRSGEYERAASLIREMASTLMSSGSPGGNVLMPLSNDDYSTAEHEEDLFHRQSRRSGMLLNSDELLTLVHLPSPAVQTPKLVRERKSSKAAPKSVRGPGLLLGLNTHAGKEIEIRLTPEQRVRHSHIIGASGTGKSTLLFNLIRQDIQNGEGVAILDPHGDLIDQLLNVIPGNRIDDVVLVDPSDEEYSVGFNILSAHSNLEKTLLASDLVSVFERLSTSWGDQMSSVLQNAILAFLESEEGGTLSDLRRFLLDPAYRAKFLQTVRDPEVVYYWQKGFSQLSGNKSIGPVLTRLETFLSPKPIRYMVSQSANRLDFADILDTGKIFLAKLPQGLIGRENAYLLGSLLISKFQQTAMSRQRQAQESRRDYWIYADEFHHFVTPSMGEILGGARKYRIGLTLAHQELRQLKRDAEVESAVLSNCGTRIVFRVGDSDARALAEGFSSFEASDLQHLDTGEAVCRVERSDFDFNLAVPRPCSTDEALGTRAAVIAASREKYARPRADIEKELGQKLQSEPSVEAKPPKAEPPQPPLKTEAPTSTEAAPLSTVLIVQSEKTVEIRPPPPSVPKGLGKGGQQHQYLQQFIRQWAQGMGYLAILEKPVPGGQVDVSLEKNNRKIACEISVTTATDHEIANVRKCLAADFDYVALVVPEQKRIAGLGNALRQALSEADFARVRTVTTDGLFYFIEELDAKDASGTKTVRGYKVKVTHNVVDQSTKKQKMEMLTKIVAESMKRKKP